jgi:hypothetical protein
MSLKRRTGIEQEITKGRPKTVSAFVITIRSGSERWDLTLVVRFVGWPLYT